MNPSLKNLNKFYLFSVILQLLLLQSCEEILDLKVSEHAPMITVNCILTAGDAIQMEINSSQPYPPLIDSSLTIKDATVKLFEDQVYIEDLVYHESYQNKNKFSNYLSLNGFIPEVDHIYSVNITAPGFPDVTSETSIPQPVPVISVDTNTVWTNYGNGSIEALECTIKFKDPPNIKNFYKLVIDRLGLNMECQYEGYRFVCKTTTTKIELPFFCYDFNTIYFRKSPGTPGSIPLEKEDDVYWVNEVFLTDNSFDNEVYSLKVLIPYMFLTDWANPPNINEKFTLRKLNVRLYSINEEYYKYAQSYFTQVYKKNDMFSEPCQVYNNILNGSGIFSGASVSVDTSIAVPIYYKPPMY